MKTLRKVSLFIAVILALGCGKKAGENVRAGERDLELDRVQAQEKEVQEEGSLESRCFEGDLEACDELGH